MDPDCSRSPPATAADIHAYIHVGELLSELRPPGEPEAPRGRDDEFHFRPRSGSTQGAFFMIMIITRNEARGRIKSALNGTAVLCVVTERTRTRAHTNAHTDPHVQKKN